MPLGSHPLPPATTPWSATPRIALADASSLVSSTRFTRVSERGAVTGGLAAVDLDHDGDLDLVATQHDGPLVALRNDGGLVFSDWPDALPAIDATTSLALFDVEGDGDLDLFIGRDGGAVILRDDGGAGWRDVTAACGLAIGGYVTGAVAADFDRDGWLDLYVLRYDELDTHTIPPGLPNELWVGAGGGMLRRATTSPGGVEPDVGASLAASASDLDDDGWIDLVVANDFGPVDRPLQIWRGLGPNAAGDPAFEEVAAKWGVEARVFGMGLALDDLDGDGRIDIYVTNEANNALFVRGAGGGFVERARELGAACGHFPDPDPAPAAPPVFRDFGPKSENPRPEVVDFVARWAEPELGQWTLTSWAPIAFDAEADGDLDLLVTNGFVNFGTAVPEGRGQPSCFLQSHAGKLAPGAESVDDIVRDLRGAARGAVVADLDSDGDDDLAWIQNGYGYDGDPGVRVLENASVAGAVLDVHLVGSGANPFAIGARITIVRGDRRLVRDLRTDTGYASAAPPRTRFGLGAADHVDAIEVRWPSGARTAIGPTSAASPVTIHERE